MEPKTTVVIIGGSYSGIGTAHAILKGISGVKVVLVAPSKKVYYNVAAPRVLAKPNAIAPEKYLFSIDTLFKKYPSNLFKFVQGAAKSIDDEAKTIAVQ